MWSKSEARDRRRRRIRKKVTGTERRPRLAVFRSARHIYAQVVDDSTGRTLAHASSREKQIREGGSGKRKIEVARIVGQCIAQRCKEKGIAAVVFDRGGYRYHGRVEALAKSARDGGLVF